MIARLSLALILLALSWVCGQANLFLAPHNWTRGYSACVTEDSSGPCYWDATKRGNGLGHSFVVTPDQKIIVIPGR
jgi:hypothetical protein